MVKSDYFIQTHVTNPLLKSETIEKAIKSFTSSVANDSLFSVTMHQTRFWNGDGNPVNHNPKNLIRTQDLSPAYEENSNIYIFSKELIEQTKNRIGSNPLMYEVPYEQALDIDCEIDFRIAEILHKNLV